MAILRDCEMHFVRCNPAHPNDKFDKENPAWEVQLRTTSKEQKKQWAELNLPVKMTDPDDGEPYYRLQLKKGSKKKDGSAADPVEVVDGNKNPIDPDTIGNGSIGNIRIWQYEFPKKDGSKGVASLLMAIQVTTLIEYKRKPSKPREEFGTEETTVIPAPKEEEGSGEGGEAF